MDFFQFYFFLEIDLEIVRCPSRRDLGYFRIWMNRRARMLWQRNILFLSTFKYINLMMSCDITSSYQEIGTCEYRWEIVVYKMH